MSMSRNVALIALASLLAAAPAAAQSRETVPPEAERSEEWFQLNPERHGVSYFARHRHPQVQYEAGDVLTFDQYHTVDVMYAWLRRWAEQHPGIVELYEVARSYEGRPILQMTLTNKATGPKEEKPAAYFEGGRHSGEITSSESVLWLAKHLIENYGRDPAITHLLDTKAVTLRPQNNPDGSNMYLHTAVMNRSTVRPVDNDGDGLFDEDEADDMDGDGVIYTMRWKPTMTGADTVAPTMVLDEKDPSGRLMRRARDGETAIWRTMSEGIDNDGDGRFNEDGIGGLDLHRNYPENWRPDRGGDATGRGYTQGGAGEFPLSEPETRSVVLWLLSNPNISVVNSMDTRVPMHLRPPSTSKSEERMYPEDLRYYEHFDTVGLRITEYPWAGDVYHTYATRNNPEGNPSPLFGHGPDFGYFYYGSIWYGDELWNGGIMRDENGDGERDQLDALIWDDRENGGANFKPWTAAHHPVFGDVEVGGFHPKFFSQNGPPNVLERWASRQALFNLEMAYALPELAWQDVRVRRVQQHGADSATYEVRVQWKNNGRLPTALKQAQLVKIVQEDRLNLSFVRDTAAESRAPRIMEPDLRGGEVWSGWTEPGQTKTVTYRVRTYGAEPVRANLRLDSTRGGVLRREIEIVPGG
ncbi:MAG TPA: M14 family metallopeptidase [Longimicrobiales bacterium]|nr:M14 family metallopeptidase [Longimicrobiales bacterium]